MQLVLGLAIVTGIGLGAGFGLSKTLLKPDPNSPAAATVAAEPHTDAKGQAQTSSNANVSPETLAVAAADFNPADLKDVVLTPFAPITSNLAIPDNVWIRLEGSMAIKAKDGIKPADLAQLASDKIIAYLKTLKLVDIQGPVGFLAFNSDLNEIVRSATDGQARSVLISGFIVE